MMILGHLLWAGGLDFAASITCPVVALGAIAVLAFVIAEDRES